MWWLLIPASLLPVLMWMLWRCFVSDRLRIFSDRRRNSSQMVGRGEFVDGRRHLEVALALTDVAFYYENEDMEAALERQWIHEVEYDDELSTGQGVGEGTVLRLRCFSQMFEFILPHENVRQWETLLPPHRLAV